MDRMPRPCSDDLRMNAVKKVMAGKSCRSVAKQLRVAASSVIKWVRRHSDTESVRPSRMGSRRTPKLQGWIGGRGVAASVASIWRFLKS